MAPVGRNLIANYIGTAWTAILSIALTPIYLKFLGIESYALVGLYAALTSILGILDLGIGTTLNRELARLSTVPGSAAAQRNVVRTLELIYWGVAVLAGAFILLLAPYITNSWVKAETLYPQTMLKAVRLMGIGVAL